MQVKTGVTAQVNFGEADYPLVSVHRCPDDFIVSTSGHVGQQGQHSK